MHFMCIFSCLSSCVQRLWLYESHYICTNYSIPVGKNNRYGHPNKEVLNNLENSKIYRTDQDGSITIKIKNNKLQNNKLKIEFCIPQKG